MVEELTEYMNNSSNELNQHCSYLAFSSSLSQKVRIIKVTLKIENNENKYEINPRFKTINLGSPLG